jgi:hypothetical protein
MKYDHDNAVEIAELFVGHKVVKIADNKLELDDGRILTFIGSADCCQRYDLTELNGCDNVITSVELLNDPGGDEYHKYDGEYRIFVYADNVKINLATFEGSDANGYYGTGYTIEVRGDRK